MNGLLPIAWNGFREARRNRVTVVVAAFAVAILLCSTLVSEVTVATFDRVLTDFGLGSMSLIMVFLAIFLSCGVLSREIERRTIFMVVSKPVSRSAFLLGRIAGNAITLAVLLAVMTAILVLQLKLLRAEVTAIQFVAIAALWFELLILTAVGTFFSTFSGQATAAVATTGIYLAGHLAPDIYNLGTRSTNAAIQLLAKVVYFALPNLDRLNLRPQAAYHLTVSLQAFVVKAGYAIGWTALFAGAAAVVFARRDFR